MLFKMKERYHPAPYSLIYTPFKPFLRFVVHTI